MLPIAMIRITEAVKNKQQQKLQKVLYLYLFVICYTGIFFFLLFIFMEAISLMDVKKY